MLADKRKPFPISAERHPRLQGRIISDVYPETKDPLPERRVRSLSRSLDKWQADLPIEIRYDPTQSNQVVPPPHVLSLQ